MRRRSYYVLTEILLESIMGYGHPHARGVWMYSCELQREARRRRARARQAGDVVTMVSHRLIVHPELGLTTNSGWNLNFCEKTGCHHTPPPKLMIFGFKIAEDSARPSGVPLKSSAGPRRFLADPRVESIQIFFFDFSTPKIFYY